MFNILYIGNLSVLEKLHNLNLNGIQGELISSSDIEEALTLVGQKKPHVVLIDFDLDYNLCLEFIRRVMNESKNASLIGVTSGHPLRLTVQAIKMGVQDIVNYHEEPNKLQRLLSSLHKRLQALGKGEDLYKKQKKEYDFSQIVGESPQMKRIFALLTKIIQRKWVTILIRGETGTGKELIARAIHFNSFERFQPFVEINCSILPENLLESELFGHEKGAFTDARTQKKGLFELAQNGTLFLDEIGEISPAIQVKLLKAIENKKIRRLGGTEEINIHARIIAATNQDLQKAIQEGRFRRDLYYRLNVITVHLPPLRERGEDVLLLTNIFYIILLRNMKALLKPCRRKQNSFCSTTPGPETFENCSIPSNALFC